MTVGDLIEIEKRKLSKCMVKLCTAMCVNGESELIPKLEDEDY